MLIVMVGFMLLLAENDVAVSLYITANLLGLVEGIWYRAR